MTFFPRSTTLVSRIALASLGAATLFSAPPLARAASAPASVAIVFSPSLTSVRTDSDLPQEQGFDSDRKFGLGGGILFDAPMTDNLSLGVGGLFIARKFQIGTGSVRLERTVPTVFVPVEAKFWLGNAFSIGAGAFGAIKVGDAKDEAILGSGGFTTNSAQDRKTMDYGLTASVNFILPVMERTGLLLGARYLYGLSNNSNNPAYDERIDDFALHAGLSFSI